ncbi:MAG: EAL domain-containing protein [Lachnospiraceae bacterium]|nr:EAL domain-containing protein [Lachnospiraceae bacterium]
MFTWNFQYVSKARLVEDFNQLMLYSQKGDILIRIHTSIHLEEEAVDLARFIKGLVPGAHIFGTSASGVIGWGKLMYNQCIISVTQMETGYVRTMRRSYLMKNKKTVDPKDILNSISDGIISDDTGLLLTFISGSYLHASRFVELSNEMIPGVPMIGGVADRPAASGSRDAMKGFVFDENGWSANSIILAAIGGENFESLSQAATGAQPAGGEYEITRTDGDRIVSIDGVDAVEKFLSTTGDVLREKPELSWVMPFVYSDMDEMPILVRYDKEANELWAYQHVSEGRKVRRAFIYDGKIVSDNRALFLRVENFKKAQTVFGYSCSVRHKLYPHSVRWELSVFENSNMCGCITDGEISNQGGKNVYANISFVVAVLGEEEATQEYNPYVFSHTEGLAADNKAILSYMAAIQDEYHDESKTMSDELAGTMADYEKKLLYVDDEEYANAAALNMDMRLNEYDRICIMNVLELSSMRAVFGDNMVEMTYKNYIEKCSGFAKANGYHFYILDRWQVAIGSASYLVSLPQFVDNMEKLQSKLFENEDNFIPIVPLFCVIDDCKTTNIHDAYNSARVEMMAKNIQFMITKGESEIIDVDALKQRYHMVNVINYAIAHDKIIPYFQGIYDNKKKCISHYEALMRMEDENGNVVSPGDFLDVARSYGVLYDKISITMIKKVFEKFKDIDDACVSMNLGIRDIKNNNLVQTIYDFLRTTDHPGSFIFEILENEEVDDYELLMNFVDKIHDLGGKIALDDFGSGFSNLQHVLGIQTDYLKIDGSIVRKCCENMDSERLISLITSWKHLGSKNVKIVAEFVENEEIQKIMSKYRVDYSQGYFFASPQPDVEH